MAFKCKVQVRTKAIIDANTLGRISRVSYLET
jgi:hypothetical protein